MITEKEIFLLVNMLFYFLGFYMILGWICDRIQMYITNRKYRKSYRDYKIDDYF
jgi:hypothetical protein